MKRARPRQQSGVMLLEALVAILIFSLGVLTIVQLQTTSIKQASGAQYRTLAVTLANDLISQMWASDKSTSALQSNFASSTGGPNYTTWLSSVTSSGLPNVSSAQGTLPQVSFTTIPSSTTGGTTINQVTVTMYWQAPGDTHTHNYTVTADLIQ
jgi:type IV pilus assembly protein PilV